MSRFTNTDEANEVLQSAAETAKDKASALADGARQAAGTAAAAISSTASSVEHDLAARTDTLLKRGRKARKQAKAEAGKRRKQAASELQKSRKQAETELKHARKQLHDQAHAYRKQAEAYKKSYSKQGAKALQDATATLNAKTEEWTGAKHKRSKKKTFALVAILAGIAVAASRAARGSK